ncbi:hypothetical protein L2728_09690 [Shewanella chilikensis]|uniref:hypothetical protein n=1 Tax=Shewanella chilikensis TaxID=558541 RepID=UPI00200D0861|nr:hypothetical protein [Shewanella chilikensis]MCL1162141.1 hypothetical protein [Shewanella chilikensis]
MIVRIAGTIILLAVVIVGGLLAQTYFWPEMPPQNSFIVVGITFSFLVPVFLMRRAKRSPKAYNSELQSLAKVLSPIVWLSWILLAMHAAFAHLLGASQLASTISLIGLYAVAFNNLPSQGLALMRQRQFKVFFGPLLLVATIGYIWGVLA